MKRIGLAFAMAATLGFASNALADAARTSHPVVFAHGMAGFDDILGFDYWGDDYGTFVGDACGFLEVYCNHDIDGGQRAFAAQVPAFQTSEVRGLRLADEIESYMASEGASHVNLIGHSMGGLDSRKAARELYQRRGYTVVKVMVSVSSPHRGSPVAKYILGLGDGVTSVINALASYFGDVIFEPGNDGIAAAKALVYDDFDPGDGATTGARAFNQTYNVDSRYASRYASLMTAQSGINVNPALFLVKELFFDIDGDGFCNDDCNGDGAAGQGNGNPGGDDDDGLVGINSQQMGHRLNYDERAFALDYVSTDTSCGHVGNINRPNSTQMTARQSIINQDHMDVIGVGPDTFSEMEFYAAIFDYIAYYD
ncbi:esterase/lipase family protein [Haliangium ochraceum]|uniref:Putative lipase n=1 Tax=Haliangium ochraceum (strain DSM 14365 / JCM 11303 / SMP-2) TaxID=502025 RepID=D0LT01_HALO1|nr:acetyltransferase [Haliangium ochraceum]ACY19137.1 putative lipase [Haliangium ochraceum DSM 14365]